MKKIALFSALLGLTVTTGCATRTVYVNGPPSTVIEVIPPPVYYPPGYYYVPGYGPGYGYGWHGHYGYGGPGGRYGYHR